MIGAGLYPMAGRTVSVVVSTDFVTAFISITNPVFAFAVGSFFVRCLTVLRGC